MALAKFSEWVEFYENENAGGAVNMHMPSSTGAFTTGVDEPEESDAVVEAKVGQFTTQFRNLMTKLEITRRINTPIVRKMIHDVIEVLMTKGNLTGTERTLLQKVVTQTEKQM
jgi:hypothetical protein